MGNYLSAQLSKALKIGILEFTSNSELSHINGMALKHLGINPHLALTLEQLDKRFSFEESAGKELENFTTLINNAHNNKFIDQLVLLYDKEEKKKKNIHLHTINEKTENNETVVILITKQPSLEISDTDFLSNTKLQQNDYWHTLLESLGNGFWIYDFANKSSYFSNQMMSMLGYDDNKESSTKQLFESLIHEDDLNIVNEKIIEHANGLTPIFNCEHRLKCKDESYKWVINQGKIVLKDHENEPLRMIATVIDISTQKLFQESLNDSLIKQQELNELKTRFVSMASHEFRTPLATILLSIETLEAYWARMSEDQVSSKISKIKNNVIFLKNVIEKVLSLTHVESGRIKIKPQNSDITRMIDLIVDEYHEYKQTNHEIKFVRTVPDCIVYFDKQLMEQAIKNVVSNSIKYSESGTKIEIILDVFDNDYTITIKDQGIGIPKDEIQKLFTPFFRARNATNIRGTGLGLSLTREFIHLHHGSIKAKSELNEGSTFTITLPKTFEITNP